jgi:predicted alpha/beta-fold hydrolase
VLTAHDDPFVPHETFSAPALQENPSVTFVAADHGGHCAFISRDRGDKRFWAEASVMEFCLQKSSLKLT